MVLYTLNFGRASVCVCANYAFMRLRRCLMTSPVRGLRDCITRPEMAQFSAPPHSTLIINFELEHSHSIVHCKTTQRYRVILSLISLSPSSAADPTMRIYLTSRMTTDHDNWCDLRNLSNNKARAMYVQRQSTYRCFIVAKALRSKLGI